MPCEATETLPTESAKPPSNSGGPQPSQAGVSRDAPVQRLALLTLDLSGGDPAVMEALMTRLAQVTRYSLQREGVGVGDVRFTLVPGVTVEDFYAALGSLRGRA